MSRPCRWKSVEGGENICLSLAIIYNAAKFLIFSGGEVLKSLLRHLTIYSLLFFLTGIITCHAAPYGPSDSNTIFDRLYESDLVIYGRIIQKIKSDKKGNLTEFEVLRNIKGEMWKKGDYFYVNSIIKQPNKQLGILFLSTSTKGGREIYEYHAFYPDSEEQVLSYTLKIKDFLDREDNAGRLRWLYSQIDHSNNLIQWDSFSQLGMSQYESLKKAAPYINKESLRYLLGLKNIPDHRKSFYAFLLGLAEAPEDGPLIRRIIDNPANKNSRIIYGAMMAYGLLMNDHPKHFFNKMKDGPDNVRLAILEAIENLIKYEKSYNPAPLSKSFYWAIKNGSNPVIKRAVETAAQTRITSPVRYMKNIYFNKFANFPKGKISVINYLKFVRKNAPDAPALLKEIKDKEKDPTVKLHI